MLCLGCGCSWVFEIRTAGRKDYACTDCIDMMVECSKKGGGPGVDFVFGRLKAEIDSGWLDLDAQNKTRYRFDPEIDGRPLNAAKVISFDRGSLRIERMWNIKENADEQERRFSALTPSSLIVLREFTPAFDFTVFGDDSSVRRNAPGVLDAVAFNPSEIRLTGAIVDRGPSRPPQQYEIVTMKVNYVDLERVMDLPA
jgi:hypothetical protein